MEITECEIFPTGERHIRTLYKFNVEDVLEIEGKKEIIGEFQKINNISKGLQKRLLENGMPKNMIQNFLR